MQIFSKNYIHNGGGLNNSYTCAMILVTTAPFPSPLHPPPPPPARPPTKTAPDTVKGSFDLTNHFVSFKGTSYVREGPKSLDGSAENNALALLLSEIRSLRVQLERSIQTNNALRLKLEEQLRRPGTQSPAKSPRLTVVRQLDFTDGGKNGTVSYKRLRLATVYLRRIIFTVECPYFA